MRKLSFIDSVINEFDEFVNVTLNPLMPTIDSPSKNTHEIELSAEEKKHSAGLMRVDLTGEICAQGLYRGQALVAKSYETKANLYHAAEEEYNHLAWCDERLKQLSAKPSILNTFWYWSSFTIGAVAGSISDKLSYGFVIETENQVMDHLLGHLQDLPKNDLKSKVILEKMYIDEKEHAENAKEHGGVELPYLAKKIMKIQAKVMTTLAYRI